MAEKIIEHLLVTSHQYLICFLFFLVIPSSFSAQKYAEKAGPDRWWKSSVIYQIYPRSFQDSNGDGIGDIRGIIDRFEYLTALGIGAIWLSPIYPSPQKDFGYDVADYRTIDPIYGTMADFNELLALAHKNGIRIVMDMVFNHTSDRHLWFKNAIADPNGLYRNYYIWKKGRKGSKPPNNWFNFLGEPAWTYDLKSGEWYLHQFGSYQPDLNYENPAVQEEMLEIIAFWIAKGVDGFRFDVIGALFEDPVFPDNPPSLTIAPNDLNMNWLFQEHRYEWNQEKTFAFVRRLRSYIETIAPNTLLLGETLGPPELVRRFYGPNNDGLHLAFNFSLASHSTSQTPFRAKTFRQRLVRIDSTLPDPYRPCYAFSNHDRVRTISRYGNDLSKALLLNTLLLTTRATPVLYYGDEIGMVNVAIPRAKLQDPVGLKYWYLPISRDGSRTPMQWSSEPLSGFSAAKVQPWLPVGPTYPKINVAGESNDPFSSLRTVARLIALRKKTPALNQGEMKIIDSHNNSVLIYTRSFENQQLIVMLNFSSSDSIVDIEKDLGDNPTTLSPAIIFHTGRQKPEFLGKQIILSPYQGIILDLKRASE